MSSGVGSPWGVAQPSATPGFEDGGHFFEVDVHGVAAFFAQKRSVEYVERQIERARLKTDDPLVHEMNQHHATVNYSGKYRVATFVPDLMYPLQMTTEFSRKEDFMNINVTPPVGKVGRVQRRAARIDGQPEE